jgi:hypothetical protein
MARPAERLGQLEQRKPGRTTHVQNILMAAHLYVFEEQRPEARRPERKLVKDGGQGRVVKIVVVIQVICHVFLIYITGGFTCSSSDSARLMSVVSASNSAALLSLALIFEIQYCHGRAILYRIGE